MPEHDAHREHDPEAEIRRGSHQSLGIGFGVALLVIVALLVYLALS